MILSANGGAMVSISISCPASRLSDDLVESYGLKVAAAARQISRANAEFLRGAE